MKTYYVYILECSDSTYYTGVTNNIERRFSEHAEGINKTSYTYLRRPVNLVYIADFNDIQQAIAWEKQIKKWSRAKKQALIVNHLPVLKMLAVCINATTHVNYKKE